ncbi:hypothetical protein AGDE_15633 [Angomonas deanei]|uniref:C2 domain containing protein, putative n=1 Tax=Angomonas deanei TaxID=59799 RepID=A0A7G2CMT3_9TRYP|nr:hypothetical protein AGDE_15633 [Angomonas deanei]CAD2219572.1 C2 domain containing protein, putative [Angomonas deanei]|eukprot:EPY18724.1 hypothetical protein AGDE_15633 [Angomonas deanei]
MATIKVTVHEARDLPVMDRNSGLADSYVVLRFSSTDQSTDICWRTRHPVWESTYRFDVPDLLALQEEPLEVRVFDHDVISRDDIIGSIYLDCNSIIDRGEETALSGWFPLYDLEDGMRGDLRLTIKVKFHTTHNPFAPQLPERFVRLLKVQPDAQTNHRTAPSSNPLLFLDDNYDPVAPLRVQHPTLSSEEEGVYMFAASRLDPSVYRVESTFTMVEELIVTADPDNARLTNFKSSRTRSEARALQLYRLSGKVRRQLARKVVEMKCNAILGLTENFDIEPGCLVVRAYGTPVVLSKVKYIQESKTQRWWKRHAAHLLRGGISGQSNAIAKYPIAAPAESTQNSSFNSRESDPSHAFNGTGNKTKKPVSRAATATPDSFHPAPANPTSVAHSEDGPLPPASVEDGRGSVAPIGSGVLSGVRTSSTDLISLEVLAGNFSLVFNPSVVGGIAPTQGIHLDPTLFSSTSAEDITASTGTPLLMPAPSVTAATAPSMTAVPTVAAVVAQPQRKSVMILTIKDLPSGCIQHLGGYISVRSVKIISKAKSKIMISQERDAWWMEVREELRVNCRAMHCNTILNYREEAQFCEDVVILLLSGTAAMVDHGLLPLRVGPDQLFRKSKREH